MLREGHNDEGEMLREGHNDEGNWRCEGLRRRQLTLRINQTFAEPSRSISPTRSKTSSEKKKSNISYSQANFVQGFVVLTCRTLEQNSEQAIFSLNIYCPNHFGVCARL